MLKAKIESIKTAIKKKHDSYLESLEESNEILSQKVKVLSEKIRYTRQRENKVLYLFYWAQEQGLPLQELYEKKIKNIPTERFEGMVNSERSQLEIDPQQFEKKDQKLNSMELSSFDPSVSFETSYEPIAEGEAKRVRKPEWIKTLNFDALSQGYASSTEQNSQPKNFSSFLKDEMFESKKVMSEMESELIKFGSDSKIPSMINHKYEFDLNSDS